MIETLRELDILEELSEERLADLLAHAREVTAAPGETIVHQGEPPQAFHVLLEGRIEWWLELDGERILLGARDGVTYFGATNLMLEQPIEVTARAVLPSRLLRIDGEDFRTLLREEPSVLQRTIQLVAPVQRFQEAAIRQREKLASLGTLAAGLAHELNNPAAAARRSAQELGQALDVLQDVVHQLVSSGVERAEAEQLVGLQQEALAGGRSGERDPLELADREDALARAIEERSLEGWRLAGPLAEAGIDDAWLTRAEELAGTAFPAVLEWVVASLEARGLAADLEAATERISELVLAMKDYTYMDRGALQEVDVHEGIDSTLMILKHKLKQGTIRLEREYDPTVPHILANGSELNQVWTNLIDNALDAVEGDGTIRISTSRLPDTVAVEFEDDGPGIPADVQARLFEPFFTTKAVGKGSGLGLDVSRRIVRALGGSITLESEPGQTRFTVRLPLEQ
jgi:signal transduction histidine kinase